MRDKTRWIALTLSAALCVSTVTGCGLFGSKGDDEPTPTPIETQAPTATEIPTTAPTPTKAALQPNDISQAPSPTPEPTETPTPEPTNTPVPTSKPTEKPSQPDGGTDSGIGAGEGTQATVASAVNVRDGAGTDSNVIGELEAGEQVTVLGASNGWVMIDYNGTTGYVYQDYLR